jgi:hypothetical protein
MNSSFPFLPFALLDSLTLPEALSSAAHKASSPLLTTALAALYTAARLLLLPALAAFHFASLCFSFCIAAFPPLAWALAWLGRLQGSLLLLETRLLGLPVAEGLRASGWACKPPPGSRREASVSTSD